MKRHRLIICGPRRPPALDGLSADSEIFRQLFAFDPSGIVALFAHNSEADEDISVVAAHPDLPRRHCFNLKLTHHYVATLFSSW
jgi:hypothetical protein